MNLAIFLPNWIGDVVMATPAVRALRCQFAGARIIGVMRPYVAGVLDGSPWLDGHIFLDTSGPWRARWPSVAWKLRRERIDLAVLFPNSFRTALVAWLARCERRIGFNRQWRRWLLTEALEPVRDAEGRLTPSPIIDDYNRLAQRAGCAAPGHRLELFTTERDEKAAGDVWRRARLADYPEVICLNPGAAFGSAKCWPVHYFAELAAQFADRRGSAVLVLCGHAERDLAFQIVARAQRPSVHWLAHEQLSLGLTKACVRRADLLVTTDSGPRHFAHAFDRPVVTLFGPTHISWTETYHPAAIHLQKKVECGPCQERVCPLDHRCMTQLTPADVYRAAAELLRRYPPAVSPSRRERKAS